MDQAQHAGSTAPPALSDAIEKIMANPELISMVASVLGKESGATAPAPVSTDEQPRAEEPSEAVGATPLPKELPELVGTLAPLLAGMKKGEGSSKNTSSNSACLLRALKPYVSHGRREAIDYMIRISEFSEVLKHLH